MKNFYHFIVHHPRAGWGFS